MAFKGPPQNVEKWTKSRGPLRKRFGGLSSLKWPKLSVKVVTSGLFSLEVNFFADKLAFKFDPLPIFAFHGFAGLPFGCFYRLPVRS